MAKRTVSNNDLEAEFQVLKCTIACAARALSDAEQEQDMGLLARGTWVLNDCVERLEQFQARFEHLLLREYRHAEAAEVAHG